jgi:hypothetical protein
MNLECFVVAPRCIGILIDSPSWLTQHVSNTFRTLPYTHPRSSNLGLNSVAVDTWFGCSGKKASRMCFNSFSHLLIFDLPSLVLNCLLLPPRYSSSPEFGRNQRNSSILGNPLEFKNFFNCRYPIQEFLRLKTPVEFRNIEFETGFPPIGLSLYKGLMSVHSAPRKTVSVFILHTCVFLL